MIAAEKAGADQAHRILVVEDEVLILLDTAHYLRGRGYDVLEATNAQDAIRILNSGTPISLVFTDIRMPGALDGFGLARFIRANHANTVILTTSGHVRAADCPPDFPPPIAKPYALAEVANEIEKLLASHQHGTTNAS